MKKLILISLSSVLLFSSCSENKEGAGTDKSSGPGQISIDGSSTVYPLSEAMAEDFKASNPDVKVTIGESGTGGGFKKFGRGETDISNASRPIKPSEDSLALSNKVSYIELPVAYDGLAVVVNPENTWVDRMTVKELKKLWEPAAQGTVKKWNQIRPEWPNEEIHLFGAGTQSGTFDYFTEAIMGKSKESRGDYTASEDDNVLVQGIGSDKFALGYFGLAYYESNRDKLKLVPIDDEDPSNGEGGIAPSRQTVSDGTYQPLSRPLFIYVNAESANRPEVKDFITFYLQNSKELAEDVGYISLPPDVLTLVRQRFDAKKTGTMFTGRSDVGVKIGDVMKEANQ